MIIYLATNKINGKRYLGATKNSLKHRSTAHWYDAHGRNCCRIFGAALRKYGRDGFDWQILMQCGSKEELMREEIRLIAEMKPEYNITSGGQGIIGVPYTDERRAKLSKALKGRKMTSEQRIANAALMKRLNIRHHKSVVCLNDGRFYQSCKEASEFYGVTHGNIRSVTRGEQATTKGGLSFALSKRTLTSEECADLIRRLLDKKEAGIARAHNSKCIPVTCFTDGKKYKDAIAAAKEYGITAGRVRQLCHGGGKTQSGLQFMFSDRPEPIQKKKLTEEQIADGLIRRDAALKRALLTTSKRVICLDDDMVYASISDAARAIGRCVESVSASIRRQGRAGGKRFKFMDDAS